MAAERSAARVAAGIALSRLTGLLREKVAAHFLGVTAFGDVFALVFRGPNLLQNLLGEQALSASFIPIYAGFLGEKRPEAARRFAEAVFALLAAALSLLAVAGVVLAGPIVALLNPGLLQDAAAVASGAREVDRYVLAVAGVRVVFPMTAVLVLSAWCLGILNSHRRFFLAYVAPVIWNLAIIGAVLGQAWRLGGGAGGGGEALVMAACAGALLGAVLQVGVQLPLVIRLLGGLRPRLALAVEGVRDAIARFGPAVAGRGAAQLSGYLDLVIASFLTVGTLAALGWAQRLYLLPIALFGLSVAAVELPELSRLEEDARQAAVAPRFRRAFTTASFFLAPTLVAFLAFGYLAVALLYRGGRFGEAENWLVYLVLAAYSFGLPATVASRLLQNVFFAAGDTRTPARIAFARMLLSGAIGGGLAFALDRVRLDRLVPVAGAEVHSLAPLGLAAASAVAAWGEVAMLRRRLARVAPALHLAWSAALPAAGASVLAALPAAALWWWWRVGAASSPLRSLVVLGVLGGLYLGLARLLRVPGSPLARA